MFDVNAVADVHQASYSRRPLQINELKTPLKCAGPLKMYIGTRSEITGAPESGFAASSQRTGHNKSLAADAAAAAAAEPPP